MMRPAGPRAGCSGSRVIGAAESRVHRAEFPDFDEFVAEAAAALFEHRSPLPGLTRESRRGNGRRQTAMMMAARVLSIADLTSGLQPVRVRFEEPARQVSRLHAGSSAEFELGGPATDSVVDGQVPCFRGERCGDDDQRQTEETDPGERKWKAPQVMDDETRDHGSDRGAASRSDGRFPVKPRGDFATVRAAAWARGRRLPRPAF